MPFPNIDPIPLPAPVWLFKVLHMVTLSLHFVAVNLLIGGLLLATVWNLVAKSKKAQAEAAKAIAIRLPIVMTYVINLGVPPLLFAQVLYGRALYTSSILIGLYWIGVILLLMFGYYLLYQVAKRAEEGKTWWWLSLVSLLVISYIARIYTANMTLMLRPEVWLEMYRSSAIGAQMPTGDPTVLPRWLMMMVSSLTLTGVAVTVLAASSKSLSLEAKNLLRSWGAAVALICLIAEAAIGLWLWQVQPAKVVELLLGSKYLYGVYLWWGSLLLLALLVIWTKLREGALPAAVSALAAVVSVSAAVVLRDGIRDMTLLVKGLDVWQQPVVSSWSVVALFLGLFIAGLAVVGWMISLAIGVARKGVEQNV